MEEDGNLNHTFLKQRSVTYTNELKKHFRSVLRAEYVILNFIKAKSIDFYLVNQPN